MLPRLLQRAARQAAAGSEPLGSIQLRSCGPGAAPLAQLTSLLGWQVQQAAGYAAHHRGDAEEEEEELAAAAHSGRPHRHSKLSHSARRQLIERKLAAAEEEEEEEQRLAAAALEEEAEALIGDLKSRTPVSYARRQQIRSLLSDLGRDAADDSAAAFVTRCVCAWRDDRTRCSGLHSSGGSLGKCAAAGSQFPLAARYRCCRFLPCLLLRTACCCQMQPRLLLGAPAAESSRSLLACSPLSPAPLCLCSFFGERQQADYARLATAAGISLKEKPLVIGHGGRGPSLAYRGEAGRYAPPTEPLAGSSDDDEEQEEVEEDEEALEGSMEVRGLVTCCANRGCL